MRKPKLEIDKERKIIYQAIKDTMVKMKVDYCQSWWLTCKDNLLPINLSTSIINSRCKLLVKNGYLSINRKQTSSSMGVCYQLTDKNYGKI